MDLGSVRTEETAQLRLANVDTDQPAGLASRLTGFGLLVSVFILYALIVTKDDYVLA